MGFNKTGTTSLGKALSDFKYRVGNQSVGEMLISDWYKQDYDRIIRYCHIADAFQDVPFSLPGTYQFLDAVFPDAKLILTIRDSSTQWFESLVKYHTKLFSSDKKRFPDADDLAKASYRYKGFVLDAMKMVFHYPEVELYDFEYYTKLYEEHNSNVIQYFQGRDGKLLVLNVAAKNAYQELAGFLNITVPDKSRFPWENKT